MWNRELIVGCEESRMAEWKPSAFGRRAGAAEGLTLVGSDGRLKDEPDADFGTLSDYDAATQLIEHLGELRDRLEPESALRVDVITLLARLERYQLAR
jgi:hypothetical protein